MGGGRSVGGDALEKSVEKAADLVTEGRPAGPSHV